MIDKLYFATTNKGKLASVSRALSPYGISVIHREIDIPEIRSKDIEEIAKQKASFAYNIIKEPVIAMDAAFCIPSLHGFPLTYANFILETIGLEGILKLADGKDRKCYFEDAIAYLDGKLDEPVTFVRKVHGILSEKICDMRNNYKWSELHRVFIPDGFSMTLSEMGEQEYQHFRNSLEKPSHYEKLVLWLKENR